MSCDINATVIKQGFSRKLNTWEYYLNACLAGISLYVTLSYLGLFITKKQYRVKSKSPTGERTRYVPFFMNLIVVAGGVLGCSSLVTGIISYHVPYSPVLYASSNLCGGWFLTAVYTLLWLRQTMFHTEPGLKRLYSTAGTRVFSRIQGGFTIISSVACTVIVLTLLIQQKYTLLRCMPKWLLAFILVWQLEIHVGVVVLFVVPILKHRRSMNDVDDMAPPKNLTKLVKKSVATTVAAVTSDLAAYALFYAVKNAMVYNVNVLFNMICVSFCFADWRERLLPCFTCRKSQRTIEVNR